MNNTDFRIEPLQKVTFQPMLSMSDQQLADYSARWVTADSDMGFPCRVSLEDAKPGERMLELNYTHHNVDSPYRASGPIFIKQNCTTADLCKNEVPEMLRHRLLSIRAFCDDNSLAHAVVIHGAELESGIRSLFRDSTVAYIHIHNAMPGCFNCSAQRA